MERGTAAAMELSGIRMAGEVQEPHYTALSGRLDSIGSR
jgi:hypothetical protein